MAIGILIPTFNRLNYLRQALRSVSDQHYSDLSIIVIDNGSSDGTTEFMEQLTDSRIRYTVNEHNIGMAGSINIGIRLFASDVEWCTILCDDDILHSDFAGRMAAFLNDHPGILVASGRIIFTDDDLRERRNGVEGPEVESALSYLVARTDIKRETYLSALMFHRRSFIEMGGYPLFASGLATDDALIFHLAAQGGGFGYNRSAVCYIRIHGSAESVSLAGGFAAHLKSSIDFKDYCARIARSYGLPESTVMKTIDVKIKGLLYVLFTTRYADHLKFLQDKTGNDALLKLLQNAYAFLPFRIKLDYYCYTTFGIAIERYWPYNAFWNTAGMLYRFLRRHLPIHRFRTIAS